MKVLKQMTILAAILICSASIVQGQMILDRVVAVVGDHRILQSEIESQYLQNRAQGVQMPDNAKCSILEEFLSLKLLVNQAEIDSVEVSSSEVELELDGRLEYFISMKSLGIMKQ